MSAANEGEEEASVSAAAAATAEADAQLEATLMAEAVAVAYQSEDEAQEQDAPAEEQEEEAEPANNQDVLEGEEALEDAMSVSGGGENAENDSNESNPGEDGGNPEETAAADRRQATKKELTQIMDKWEQQHTQNGYDPIPTLRR